MCWHVLAHARPKMKENHWFHSSLRDSLLAHGWHMKIVEILFA